MRAETRVQVQTTIDGKRRRNEVQLMPIDSCPCQTWEGVTLTPDERPRPHAHLA